MEDRNWTGVEQEVQKAEYGRMMAGCRQEVNRMWTGYGHEVDRGQIRVAEKKWVGVGRSWIGGRQEGDRR